MKALVGAFKQEKALVGAFSVIVQLHRLIVYSTSSEEDCRCHLHQDPVITGDQSSPGHHTPAEKFKEKLQKYFKSLQKIFQCHFPDCDHCCCPPLVCTVRASRRKLENMSEVQASQGSAVLKASFRNFEHFVDTLTVEMEKIIVVSRAIDRIIFFMPKHRVEHGRITHNNALWATRVS